MQKYTDAASFGTRDLNALVNVALGREQADSAIINVRLVNVYTGEIIDNCSVSIKGEWIAHAGEGGAYTIGDHTRVIDAHGKTLIPGLIDGHTHLAWLYTAHEFLKCAMIGGTTTIITETLEPYPVSGCEGVFEFLDSIREQPIKIFATAPAMVSISSRLRGIPIDGLKKLLSRNDVLGLGESYWQGVFQEPEVMIPEFEEVLSAGKFLEGHSAGARGKKLMAYVATGISSCHEPITAEEALDRLRLGMHVMVREGSIRQDLKAISKIKDTGIDLRRLILATDGVEPVELLEKGYLEYSLQKAIDYGFDPVSAIQMATLNVAEHFSLDHVLGGIAPGRYADMLIIPDLKTIKAELVISKGRIIARDGELIVPPRKHIFSKQSRKTLSLPKKIEAAAFAVSVERGVSKVRVRIIEMITDLVTREHVMALSVEDAEIKVDVSRDLLKIAAIDRAHFSGKTFIGLINGFKLKSGAFACSAAWDTSDIIVIGADENDMAVAVNRISELKGGAVICNKGKILSELALPIYGIASELPLKELSDKLIHMKGVIKDLGVDFPNPLLSLTTLTGAAIPYLRICEEGLVNLKDGKTMGLIV